MKHHAILLSASLLALLAPIPARAAPLGESVVPACGGDDDKKKGDEKGSYAPVGQCDDGKGGK